MQVLMKKKTRIDNNVLMHCYSALNVLLLIVVMFSQVQN
jgi:hypothetical protein